jgi:hypothetical protein
VRGSNCRGRWRVRQTPQQHFFTGFNWNYSSKAPELVLGFRSVQTGVGCSNGVLTDASGFAAMNSDVVVNGQTCFLARSID